MPKLGAGNGDAREQLSQQRTRKGEEEEEKWHSGPLERVTGLENNEGRQAKLKHSNVFFSYFSQSKDKRRVLGGGGCL